MSLDTETILAGEQNTRKLWTSFVLACLSRGTAIFAASVGLCATMAVLQPHGEHFELAHWRIAYVKVDELRALPEGLIVDARARALYETEHIPGAMWLTADSWDVSLPVFLERWQPENKVVIYCDESACSTSKKIALRLLKDLPEAQIYVLRGGFSAWQAHHVRPSPVPL